MLALCWPVPLSVCLFLPLSEQRISVILDLAFQYPWVIALHGSKKV